MINATSNIILKFFGGNIFGNKALQSSLFEITGSNNVLLANFTFNENTIIQMQQENLGFYNILSP